MLPLFSSNKRGERRVSPRVYRLLLSTHIIVSVGWLGIVFAKLVLGLHAMTSDAPDVSEAPLAARVIRRIGMGPRRVIGLSHEGEHGGRIAAIDKKTDRDWLVELGRDHRRPSDGVDA